MDLRTISGTLWDPLLRDARLRLGKRLHARGVPAVLLGVAGVVVASGVARALAASAPRLPETLGEARALVRALRDDRPLLR